ncbi:HAD hydrolase-like protein [Clostridium swellfunianum]|uniref:5' nucleotidase, NT5C type n=1 Tax=Clostridium swellfunianum TaxID=1367462 RepID=UPI00202EC6ED|nr:HAD hydrolase-like protein [Clostridium swellfunianum]MCM0650017.1 HAD hydrolase-like protein [Clostridium swellfunianum]
MKKIFLDFDCTIADTVQAYCKVYNSYYKEHEGFKEADYNSVNRYDFKDQCPLIDHTETIFAKEELLKNTDLMPNAKEVLERLASSHELVICSLGNLDNISNKAKWIKNNLPFIKNVILISSAVGANGMKMDKSSVDMKNSIFIDDHIDSLLSSNAEVKICFGKEYSWNKSWTGQRCIDWREVEKLLL